MSEPKWDEARWLTPAQASAYLFGGDPSRTKTLEAWRNAGTGPRFAKAGRRVVYRLDWLREWLEARSVMSTAEAKAQGIR